VDSLVRRIKDLDQITFQQLCFHVMSERFPYAKVRYPEGSAGDEGVDLFQGNLTQGPTVWQCKAFTVTILGDSQKGQIKESLRDAIKNVQPRLWILCLNLNLDTKAARWFQRLQQSYANQGITVADPFDAMELARELIFRRTIRNHFFPNLTLDVQGLKSLVKAAASGMDSIEDADLEKLATENTEEYLDRLRDRDPRFTYEVTFGGERGPNVFAPSYEPHLVSSKTDGRKTIKAYARDHEALRQDPVGSLLHFNETGGQKFLDFIRTGKEQTWDPEEIRAFKSTVPLLSEMKFLPGSIAMSVRSMPDDRTIPLKLMFSKGDRHAALDYVEFRKVRSGVEEVEITTVDTQPLGITLTLPFNTASAVTATISTNLPGQKIREVAKVCAALKLLQTGCTLELTSLKLNGHLCTLVVDPLQLSFKPGFFRFVEDLAAIATKFNVNFPMPSTLKLPRDEEETFMILRAFALNEPLELTRFTASFIKCPENATVVPQQFRNEIVVRLEHENANATLFGVPIRLGPTRIQVDRAQVIQLSATMKKFTNAKMGTAVPIRLRPLVPVRFELVDYAALLPPHS
jgi:hypothetical protein